MGPQSHECQALIGSRKRPKAHPINALLEFDQNLYHFYDLPISRQTSRYSRWYVKIFLILCCGDGWDENWGEKEARSKGHVGDKSSNVDARPTTS